MIREFMGFLEEHEATDEYRTLVSSTKSNPGAWMDQVQPWQYIYSAFRFNEFEPDERRRWGTLHRAWYNIAVPLCASNKEVIE